jgi:ATP-binding cassette subfamily B protein
MNDLRKLLHYFRPYKISLITGIACIMAYVVFNVSVPLIVGNVIDANWKEITWGYLTIAALKVMGLSFVSGVFLFLQRRILIGMSRHVEYDLRNDFYARWSISRSRSFTNIAREI